MKTFLDWIAAESFLSRDDYRKAVENGRRDRGAQEDATTVRIAAEERAKNGEAYRCPICGEIHDKVLGPNDPQGCLPGPNFSF